MKKPAQQTPANPDALESHIGTGMAGASQVAMSALADLWERDSRELADNPSPGVRKFSRKLAREAKKLKEAAR